LLTGCYPWRNPKASILAGDAPLIIDEGAETLPKMLGRAGYRTGIVGKWHLGLGGGDLDWNGEIKPSPVDVGFDESYILAATNDRVPCVYIDGRRVDGLDPSDPIEVSYARENPFRELPTGRDNPDLLRMRYSHGHDMSIVNGVSRIGYMRGGKAALWDDETMAEVFLDRAKRFVSRSDPAPFFLYYALHQPHVPRIPSPRFAGKTGLGPRGDVIAEMDWCVGELLAELERNGIAEDTIVIFSSDNGPVLDDGYEDRAAELSGDHMPAGPLRGGKYSMYDGGTRVPFILRWPAEVAPGESAALVSQMDLLASLRALTGAPAGSGTGVGVFDRPSAPDSENVLPAFLGRSDEGRSELVVEGMRAKTVLRRGHWTYIPPHEGPAVSETTGIELGNASEPQLYNLEDDIGQIRNRALDEPERVGAMQQRLTEIRESTHTA
jgi:arylsulfatase A-like enzyme